MSKYETREEELMAFQEDAFTTKEDVLFDLKWRLEDLESGKGSLELWNHSVGFKNAYIDLIKRFFADIEKTTLFEKLEPWWSYECEIDDSGASLLLRYFSSVDFDDEGNMDTVSIGQEFVLVKTSSRLLTVEQYAEQYDVTVSTVRQWIRRGKLRSAIKTGNEWRIPELCEITDRGYKTGYFEVSENVGEVPEEYAFIKDGKGVVIMQNKDKKDEFIVMVDYNEKTKRTMDSKEREKFELFLISNPMIKAQSEWLGSFL